MSDINVGGGQGGGVADKISVDGEQGDDMGNDGGGEPGGGVAEKIWSIASWAAWRLNLLFDGMLL
jgi:hypothetical protein